MAEKKSARVTLTKKQASGGVGKSLLEICVEWLEDGKFEEHELEELENWLESVPTGALPATDFLKEEVEDVIELSDKWPTDYGRIHRALLRVVPKEERDVAKAARREAIADEIEKDAPQREARRRQKMRESAELRRRYAEEWREEPASEAQREFISELGGSLSDRASMLDASYLIEELLYGDLVEQKDKQLSLAWFIMVAIVIGIVVWWVAKAQ